MEGCKNEQKGTAIEKAGLAEIYCEASLLVQVINQKNDDIRNYKLRVELARKKLNDLLRDVQQSVGRVSQGGQQLTETLRLNSPAPDGILADIDLLLANNSRFMTGVQAKWLQNAQGEEDFTEVKNLRALTEKLKQDITDEKSTFPKFMTEQAAKIGKLQAAFQEKRKAIPDTAEGRVAGDAWDAMMMNLETAKNDLGEDSKLLDWAAGETDKILAAIPELEEGSAKYKAFVEARERLLFWKLRMESLKSQWAKFSAKNGEDPFSRAWTELCGSVFGGEKKNALTLKRIDLIPGGSSTAEQVLAVEIVCSSRFTVSAGVVFSTVLQQEFAIRPAIPPGGGTPVSTFVVTSHSRFHPLPLGMVHARFYEPNEKLSAHAAFGVAGNFKSDNAGGSDAEFLFGISFSLFRTMFITPGLHLGRQVDLSSGFQANQAVPSGITEPPLRKSYKAGFGLAITFTKP